MIQAAGLQISRELGYQTAGLASYRASLKKNSAAEATVAKAL
jgi:hypothetical protein